MTDTAIQATLDELQHHLEGELVRPGDPGYEEARALWNGMIDLRPAAIAHCVSAADVSAAVTTARSSGLAIAVRGGGHNVAGLASVADGLVIDLTRMRDVDVDPTTRRVTAGGGALLGDLDAASQAHGLAVPAGVVSATGVSGLTLNGGLGWLRRRYGLTCDHLVGAQLVTADGGIRDVNADTDPELLWGLRGGGGNFGVVTRLTFEAQSVGPEVAFLFCFYPIESAPMVLAAHERLVQGTDEISTIVVLGHVPYSADFDPTVHGAPFIALVGMHAGPAEVGEHALAELRSLAPVLADLSSRLQYRDAQTVFDADYPDGHRYYWKSTSMSTLSDPVIEILMAFAQSAPSPESTIDIWLGGGAIARVSDDATAFHGRRSTYVINLEANWHLPSDDAANIAWARDLISAIEPYADGGSYLNFPGFLEEGNDLVRRSLGKNYERLAALKARVDPDNIFRRNANITPKLP